MEDLLKNIANLTPEQRSEFAALLKSEGIGISNIPIIPRANKEAAPLSFAQERLWFLYQLYSGHPSDNVPVALCIDGEIDRVLLQKALNAILARHEILSSEFIKISDQPVQQPIESNEIEIEIEEVTIDVQDGTDSKMHELVREVAQSTFELAKWPLIKAKLISQSPTKHVVILNLHHIICDGLSMGILFNELSILYQAFLEGRAPNLPELSIQYADYAQWQRQWMEEELIEDQLKYWEKQLKGCPPVLELPRNRPRPSQQDFNGAKHFVEIDSARYQKLQRLAQSNQCTLFMVVSAIYNTLLYRYTGSEDVIIGTPMAKRNRKELQHMIGLFLNMLVLRTNFSANPTFDQLLKQVKDVTLEAYQNEDVPFEKLVERLSPERDMSYHPMFQVVLQISNQTELQLGDAKLSPFWFDSGTSQYDLALHLFENETGLKGYFEYSTSLFDPETIERMAGHFETLIDSVIADPTLPVSSLRLLTEQEIETFEKTTERKIDTSQSNLSIIDLFEDQVKQNPKLTAISYQGDTLDYDTLNRKANQLANYLLSRGISKGDLVGICADPSLELIVGILAILKSGGAYLPIDLSYPKERLAFMLEDAKAPMLLTQKALADKIPENAPEVIFLDDVNINNSGQSNPGRSFDPTALAYVIYTSGSTGKPKGVKVSHYNVVRLFQSTEHWFNFTSSDVWTLFHSYAFDFSVWEIWGALLFGGKLVVVPQMTTRDPELFYDLLVSERVTVLNQTPSAFNQLIKAEESKRTTDQLSLRTVIFGGEALDLQSLAPWFERHGDDTPKLVNMYGITETTVHVTYRPLSARDLESGSVIGEAIPDLKVYIFDSALQPVPLGIPGEMFVGGAGVSEGYLERPELNKSRFIKNPHRESETLYRTGDLARFITESDIEYLGRIDHQVKIRGFRIELGEIESVLMQQEIIREAAVLVREDTPGDKRLVAYLVANDKDSVDPGTLRNHMLDQLPEYMVPANYVLMESFPITPNGKLDHKALPIPEIQRNDKTEYTPPQTELEIKVADIWLEELHISKIGIHDSFFDLGGHSLSLTKLSFRLKKELGFNVSLGHFYKAPTIFGIIKQQEKLDEKPSEGHSISKVTRKAYRANEK
ncbi:MAG: non-ribosomal peptide synthetase [Cyclobacteriaceae bacterium]